MLGVAEALLDMEGVLMVLTLAVAACDSKEFPLGEKRGLALPVSEPEVQGVGVGEVVWEALCVSDSVEVAQGVTLEQAVALSVPVSEALSVGLALPLSDTEVVPVAQ